MPWPLEPAMPGNVLIRHAAVIPVFDENEHIAAALSSIKQALQYSPEPVAVLLVINEPAHAAVRARNANRELLASLRRNDGKYDGGLIPGKELFFIDLTDKEIPAKYRTVGNARKIGFDGILSASDGKVTDRDRLLFSLDADTSVEQNYFAAAFECFRNDPAPAGAVYNFEHRVDELDNALRSAVMRYEVFLLDYAAKLRRSGSIYGFWTIGSAFVCTAQSYVRCGGMRRHAAGEDFYFLQALRKTGMVTIIKNSCVHPAGRLSERVPFGTGPAIAKQLAGEELRLYNGKCFELLREFFCRCDQADLTELAADIGALAPPELQVFLADQNFSSTWQKIVKNTPKVREKLLMALQIYCDGFFILKFCHHLENTHPEQFARTPVISPQEKLVQLRREFDLPQ